MQLQNRLVGFVAVFWRFLSEGGLAGQFLSCYLLLADSRSNWYNMVFEKVYAINALIKINKFILA